jgi:dihydrofolate synthase / folylpolyglutamate synthase
MIAKSYKTHKIKVGEDIFQILDKYLPKLEDKSVVAITSKIISIAQGDVVPNDGTIDKDELVKKEADFYIENDVPTPQGKVFLTRKDNHIVFTSGIDESNADDNYILWPKNIQETTNKIWQYLLKKHKIKNLGVIVTDSRFNIGRTGTLGFALSWCGFDAHNDFVGKEDIFGRKIHWIKVNVIDSLATAAALEMGEAAEQTPLAVFTDLPFVKFKKTPPTKKEIEAMNWPIEKDLYGALLTSVKWKKGGTK